MTLIMTPKQQIALARLRDVLWEAINCDLFDAIPYFEGGGLGEAGDAILDAAQHLSIADRVLPSDEDLEAVITLLGNNAEDLEAEGLPEAAADLRRAVALLCGHEDHAAAEAAIAQRVRDGSEDAPTSSGASDLAHMLLEEHDSGLIDTRFLTDCDLRRAIDASGAKCSPGELASLLASLGKKS